MPPEPNWRNQIIIWRGAMLLGEACAKVLKLPISQWDTALKQECAKFFDVHMKEKLFQKDMHYCYEAEFNAVLSQLPNWEETVKKWVVERYTNYSLSNAKEAVKVVEKGSGVIVTVNSHELSPSNFKLVYNDSNKCPVIGKNRSFYFKSIC